MEVSGQRNVSATLLPGIAPPLLINRRLGRPQSRCRPFGEEKNPFCRDFNPVSYTLVT